MIHITFVTILGILMIPFHLSINISHNSDQKIKKNYLRSQLIEEPEKPNKHDVEIVYTHMKKTIFIIIIHMFPFRPDRITRRIKLPNRIYPALEKNMDCFRQPCILFLWTLFIKLRVKNSKYFNGIVGIS